MHPTLFKLGPLTLHSYGLMIAMGFLAALHFIRRDCQRRLTINPDVVGNLALWTFLFGIVGARTLHIIMFHNDYSWRDPVGWIAIWNGGLVFQGALLAAPVYLWYATRKYDFSFWALADCVVPYLALAHGFGRVGCFLNGCCYGKPTNMPWGIAFPRVPWNLSEAPVGSPPYLDQCQRYDESFSMTSRWSHPIHPTQLYGVIGLLLLCGVLLYLRRHWHPFDGFTLPVYLVIYGAGRVFVEFFRGDHNPTIFGYLSDQQVFSIVFAFSGVALFVFLKRRAKQPAHL